MNLFLLHWSDYWSRQSIGSLTRTSPSVYALLVAAHRFWIQRWPESWTSHELKHLKSRVLAQTTSGRTYLGGGAEDGHNVNNFSSSTLVDADGCTQVLGSLIRWHHHREGTQNSHDGNVSNWSAFDHFLSSESFKVNGFPSQISTHTPLKTSVQSKHLEQIGDFSC